MGTNYKKLLSGVVVVTTLGGTQHILAKTTHMNAQGQVNGSSDANTCGSSDTASADAQAILNGLIVGTYPKDTRPKIELKDGALSIRPASASIQDYNDLMDWLYSQSAIENSKLMMLGGKLYINVAKPGHPEQLLRISLPNRPQLPEAQPPAGDEPGFTP